MPASTPPSRFAAWAGLRGLAVLLVIVMHCHVATPTLEGSMLHDGLKRVFCLSFCGVDLFVFLSGLLIGGILLDYLDSPRLLLYLFHSPALYGPHGIFRHQPVTHFDATGASIATRALVVAVGLGAPSWRFFEAPLLKLAHRFSYR
ncbi:MAG: Acyltransferase family [Verrucomicrobiota bacterium]|jgi:peptidoglycan/LPS O-acetylase OafA/YrhL